MENKLFDKIEGFIAEKLKANTAAIEVTAASVESATAKKEKAEQKMEKALGDGNVDEYQKGQDALKKAEATITVHGSMLNKLKEAPILSQAEYEKMVSDVMAEMSRTTSADKEKIISLIDQIADIADAESEFIKRGNDILKKLQHDLNRDADCTTVDRNGYKQHDQYREKRFKDLDVVSFSNRAIGSEFYKQNGGTRKLYVPNFFNR